jgi:hypothetical protein
MRTIRPEQGQLEHSGIGRQDPVLRRHRLGNAARSYWGLLLPNRVQLGGPIFPKET